MISKDAPTIPELEKLPAVSRKTLLGTLGAGALALTAATAGMTIPSKAFAGVTDVDILNFALNLEYLEAEFYTYATTGHGIEGIVPTNGVGHHGKTVGGKQVNFGNALLSKTAHELAFDEQQHVVLLHQALGSAAVAKPAINLNALGIGFANRDQFLVLGRALEDTGVSAYAGAAPLIQSKAYLAVAARILGTEAEHSGNIRLQVAAFGVQTKPLDSLDVLPPPSGERLFTVNNQALVPARTVQQVLAIVRPFFPEGLNGTIR